MEIPDTVPNAPFRRADHARFGLSEHDIDSDRFLKPFPGVRLARSADSHDPGRYGQTLAAARNFAPRLRTHDVFSHTTALKLYGCPIRDDELLHISVPYGRATSGIKGVVGHRYRTPIDPTRVGSLPVAPPMRALLQSATLLSERELIIAIDHLVCPRRSHPAIVTLDDVYREVLSASDRGIRKLRRAVEHARAGAESRYETLLRLALISRGITDLELQVVLHDSDGFVGRFDLVSRSRGAIFEYDGEQHRTDRDQYLTDIERLERARSLGWVVLRFHYADLMRSSQRIDEILSRANLTP